MIRRAKTVTGWVKGLPAADPRITSYKGIPFAAPPTGMNRWRAPQPAQSWAGDLEAYAFANISMQAVPGLGPENVYTREWNVDPDIPMGEDCLYLNVWTNAMTAQERKPVLVWFFGGGLQCGNPAEMEFDGERLARRDIVVVTVNYRVNVFGFLTCGEICEAQPEAPANFGLLDQQAGIRWVKENITAFGGDPEKITIAGQSAGGGSVMSHLTSPQSEGLFQQVIVESGVMCAPYKQEVIKMISTLDDAKKLGESFLYFIGAANLNEAREMDAVYIRDKYLEFDRFFGTVIDGVFCIDEAYRAYMRGSKPDLPMLAGLTGDEFICPFPCDESDESFQAKARELFGQEAETFREICFQDAQGDVKKALKNAEVRGIECTLRSMFETDSGTHYMYYFDNEIPGGDHMGSFHSVDLWFFFETLAKCWRPFTGRYYDEARILCNYWADFVKTGDPNGLDADGSRMPVWEKYSLENPYCLHMTDKGIQMCRDEAKPLVRLITEQLKKDFGQ